MSVRIESIDLRVLNMRTRMPFKYGIATLTALPHLIVAADVWVDGKVARGLAADGLPPKWFTKNPDTSVEHDLLEMIGVIRNACSIALQVGEKASVFDLWNDMYQRQGHWGAAEKLPPLLTNFGTSLIERSVIDAFCRAKSMPFASALRSNALGVKLVGMEMGDLLPAAPLRKTVVRHTVGLSDPLTDGEIPANERADDGLPQSLEAAIQTYGLTHFKIKLTGDAERDRARLRSLLSLISRHCSNYAFTLDGNENFHDLAGFRSLWESLTAERNLAPFLSHLIFVEQPLHRSVALSEKVKSELLAWKDRPAMIIDESDADLSSLPSALDAGYAGTSHKNCKGIFKSIANAALLARRAKQNLSQRYILSAEDLANVGPIALLQDLAVLATLGISHAERNGHHYFKGLSAFPDSVQRGILKSHPDLYREHEGYPTLAIDHGVLSIGSVVDAPFGYVPQWDLSEFTPLDRWTFESLQ